jgi:hypothetical protein
MNHIIFLLLILIYLLYNYNCNNYDKFTISSQVSENCQNELINLEYINKDNTDDKTICVVKLNQLCSGSKTDTFNCAECVGNNQQYLEKAGCENTDTIKWCSLANVNNNCYNNVRDKLSGVCNDDEINYYCNNPTIFRYLYTFHPDPILNPSELAGRDYSSALNLYINYDNASGITYFSGIPCDPIYSMMGDYKNSYPYLTRVDISKTNFFTSLFNSSNVYIPNDDCRCKKNNKSGRETLLNDHKYLINEVLRNLCISNFDYLDNYTNENRYDKLKSSIIDLEPLRIYSLGNDIINDINESDINTVYLPDMQWFTNFSTMDNISMDLQKLLQGSLFNTENKYKNSQLYEKVNLCTQTDLPHSDTIDENYIKDFNKTSLIFQKYEDKLNEKIFNIDTRNQNIKDVSINNSDSSINIEKAPNYCSNENIDSKYPNEFLDQSGKFGCDYKDCDYKQ